MCLKAFILLLEILFFELKALTQVFFPYYGVVGQLLASALEQDLALKHRERASKKV